MCEFDESNIPDIHQQSRTPETGERLPEPSNDFAWMLGVLSGGGHVSERLGAIQLTRKDKPLLQEFAHVGEKIFMVQPKYFEYSKNSRVAFYDRDIVDFLGDMRRSELPHTLIDRHGWIFDNEDFIWNYLRGYFDVAGNIYRYWDESVSQRIVFSASTADGATILQDVLLRIGLNGVTIQDGANSKIAKRLTISRRREVQKFSKKVYSCVPDKEAMLQFYRELDGRLKNYRDLPPGELAERFNRFLLENPNHKFSDETLGRIGAFIQYITEYPEKRRPWRLFLELDDFRAFHVLYPEWQGRSAGEMQQDRKSDASAYYDAFNKWARKVSSSKEEIDQLKRIIFTSKLQDWSSFTTIDDWVAEFDQHPEWKGRSATEMKSDTQSVASAFYRSFTVWVRNSADSKEERTRLRRAIFPDRGSVEFRPATSREDGQVLQDLVDDVFDQE